MKYLDSGTSAFSLGSMFAVAAVGGLLGAIAAPALQNRLHLKTMVLIMGWTAAVITIAVHLNKAMRDSPGTDQ